MSKVTVEKLAVMIKKGFEDQSERMDQLELRLSQRIDSNARKIEENGQKIEALTAKVETNTQKIEENTSKIEENAKHIAIIDEKLERALLNTVQKTDMVQVNQKVHILDKRVARLEDAILPA